MIMLYGMMTRPDDKGSETGEVLLVMRRNEIGILYEALKSHSDEYPEHKAITKLLSEFDHLPIWGSW